MTYKELLSISRKYPNCCSIDKHSRYYDKDGSLKPRKEIEGLRKLDEFKDNFSTRKE